MKGIWGIVYQNKQIISKTIVNEISKLYFCDQIDESRYFIYGTKNDNDNLYEDNEVRVVCDAKFYNYKELTKLVDRQYAKANEHARIIACLFKKEGTNFLKKIRGVFSIAIFEKRENELFIATDRFGIKPIVYFDDRQGFFFASKINHIMLAGITNKIDYNSILLYLNYFIIPSPCTIFHKIYRLLPGSYAIVKSGNLKIYKYWDMEYEEDPNSSKKYFSSNLKEIIENATELYVKDCDKDKIGAFLSGGTDSSAITGILSSLKGKGIKTFSIGFDDQKYNELEYARIAADHFKTKHYEYHVSPQDVINCIPIIQDKFDQPFGNSSAIPSYYCSKLAKSNGVDVMFAGDGGDELFAGNKRYAREKFFEIYQNIPLNFRKVFFEPMLFMMPDYWQLIHKAKKYVKRSNLSNPQRYFSYSYFLNVNLDKIFSADFLYSINNDNLLEIPKNHFNNCNASSLLNKLLYIDLKMTLTDNDLPKVNEMADAAEIQVRYPFLDNEVTDFSGKIPAQLKLNGLKLRYIYKEAFKSFLPKRIIQKKKHGFGLPISNWIRDNAKIKGFTKDILLSSEALQRGYFRKKFIEDLFNEHVSNETPYYGDILWSLVTLELWHLKYFKN